MACYGHDIINIDTFFMKAGNRGSTDAMISVGLFQFCLCGDPTHGPRNLINPDR